MYPGPEILQRQSCRPGPSLAKHPSVQALAFSARATGGADTGATDLLGARCLSGYTAPREGDGCGETSSRKDEGGKKKKAQCTERDPRGAEPPRGSAEHRMARAQLQRPTDRMNARGLGRPASLTTTHARTHTHTPRVPSHPGLPSTPPSSPSPSQSHQHCLAGRPACAFLRAAGWRRRDPRPPPTVLLVQHHHLWRSVSSRSWARRGEGAPTPGALRFVGATTDRPVLARAAQRAGL